VTGARAALPASDSPIASANFDRPHFALAYVSATTTTLSDHCDFAQLIKVYVNDPEGQRRYSPPDVTRTERVPVMRNPDPKTT